MITMTNPGHFKYHIPITILLTICLLHLGTYEVKAGKSFLMDEPLSWTASVAVCGNIYIFGGENQTNITDRIIMMDPDTGEMGSTPMNLPFPVANSMAVTDGKKAYIIGGKTGEIVKGNVCVPVKNRDLVVFTPPDQIEQISDFFPYDIEGNAIAFNGNYFYLFGNCMCGSKDVRRNVIRFDPKEREYEIYESVLPSNMSGGAAVWYGDAAYIFGGKTDGNRTLDTVLRYVPGEPVEVLTAHLPVPVFKTGIARDEGLIYILGGQTSQGPTDTIQLFDPEAKEFSRAENSLVVARATRACAVLRDNIYLVGGDTPQGSSNSVEQVSFIETEQPEEKWSYGRDDILLAAAIVGSVIMASVVAVIYIRDYVKYRKQKGKEIDAEIQSKKEEE